MSMFLQFEVVALYILIAALVLLAVGYLWLVRRAFSVGFLRGLSVVPLVGIPFFAYSHREKARAPMGVLYLGMFVACVLPALMIYAHYFRDLGPHARFVDGELHVTLTKWDRDDYAELANFPDAAVLQMANPDVTDETLARLAGMKSLHELDLNHTKITDDGLAVIAKLPALKSLRIAGTAITDEGFKTHLAPLEGLRNIDVTKTKVRSKTVREWKAAADGRLALGP